MRRSLVLVFRSGLLLVTLVLAVSACERSLDDPASAQCAAPPVALDQPVDLGTHQEVVVHFNCEGATLTGTLYLTESSGRHPTVVWILGGQQTARLTYGDLVGAFTQAGVGFFSYDKRGGGQSQGVGTSQAGWIVPRAVADSHHVAFAALASAAVLPYDQVKAYAELTGGSGSDKPLPSKEEIAERLQDTGPSGTDPKPYLEQLTIPALWLYGTADREVPVDQSIALLNMLKAQGKDFTIVTFPNAGHGLLDSPPTAPPSTHDVRCVGAKAGPRGDFGYRLNRPLLDRGGSGRCS